MAALEVTRAQKEAFASEYELFSQQKESKIAVLVDHQSFEGISYQDVFQDEVIDADVVVGRAAGADTVFTETGYTANILEAVTYTVNKKWDDIQVAEMIANPQSKLVAGIIAKMNVLRDRAVLAAMIGTARRKKADGTYEDIALPAGQKIATATSGKLTVADLLTAQALMDDADVDDMDRYVAITPANLRDLFEDPTFANYDYNTSRVLNSGKPGSFLGFQFVTISEKASLLGDVTVAFQAGGILYGYNMGRNLFIDRVIMKNWAWGVHVDEQYGAVRREDVCVVEITTTV